MNSIEKLFPADWRFLYHIIFFPLTWIAWAVNQSGYLFAVNVIFLVLPLVLFLIASLCTTLSIMSLFFRGDKRVFFASVLIAWIDGGKAVLLFWAGILKFAFFFIGWIGAALRIVIYGLFQTLKDVIFSPLTFITHLVKGYARPGIPWIAVMMTLLWVVLEGGAFTFFTLNLVEETVVALTDISVGPLLLAPIMFIFISLIIGGSFASMHVLVESIEQKKIFSIVKMVFVELVVMSGEVFFFYKEFVHSALSQLSQMGIDIHFGLLPVMFIAFGAWTGVRATTWFLFAKFGTPTLLLIISREGIGEASGQPGKPLIGIPLSWIKEITTELQGELDWFSKKGEEITAAFMLPPIQVLAAMTNFCMILFTGKILFNLPIKNLSDLKDTKHMLSQVVEKDK